MTSPEKINEAKEKYIVPPGLLKKMFEFHALLETSEGAPILITGPTGVGKSLFIHMYKKWFENKKQIPPEKMNTVNCSHFEKALSRSELFGYVQGAFTGAKKNKDGWIKKSEGGILILEEIGELPVECQAQLLTFIEDGKYHRVGDTDIRQGKQIAILGATNRQSHEMREDFWNRFIKFSVPPLYTRRGDVLYLIASKYPDILDKLQPYDTLTLLAYNWPGNVREIDQVIKSIKLMKYLRSETPWQDDGWNMALDIPMEHSKLSPQYADYLHNNLEANGVDVDLLEKLLNNFNVGISLNNAKVFLGTAKPGEKYLSHKYVTQFGLTDGVSSPKETEDVIKSLSKYEKLFDVTIPKARETFFQALIGYEIFCTLFFQNPKANDNSLAVEDFTPHVHSYAYSLIPPKYVRSFEDLQKQVFEYLSCIKLKKDMNLPLDFLLDSEPSRLDVLNELADKHADNEFLEKMLNRKNNSKEQNSFSNIFDMCEDELLRYYYEKLYEQYGRNVEAVANASGKATPTIYKILKNFNISIK